jgi:two-component system cell cycle sensor histidine kinase/response regulator CckA
VDQSPLDLLPTRTSVGQVPMDRLRSIFDGMFDGVWLLAVDGRTTYANGAMGRLLGTVPSEMRGHAITDYLDPGLWAQAEEFLARQPALSGERMELRLLRVDGSEVYVIVAASAIDTPEGIGVGTMLNVSDVTGKHRLDAQIMQNQRLEAIGEFAGGIAHDFNNLLTAIHGYAELALAALPEDDPIRGDLRQVLAGASRASAIAAKLLAFTRRQVLMPVDVDPAQVIGDLVPILRPLMGCNIDIDLDVHPGSGWVRVDPTQLEQVIVNLAVNARDAMPTGGILTFAIADVKPTDPRRPDPDLTAGPFVRMSVSDTGTGMDDATKAKIFDPFFTTKDVGKGSGLGLSTVFGIIAQSDGQIAVETSLGHGSTFHVDLPRVDPGPPPEIADADIPLLLRRGVVLVVEDDPAVREFSRRSLETAGYTVLTAADAAQALRASALWSERIDVLVTDIVMPGVHGPDLAVQILGLRPQIGVVFVSGYAEDAIARRGGLADLGEYLPKPFSVESLRAAVRRAAVMRAD